MRNSSKKKTVVIVIVSIAVAALVLAGAWFFWLKDLFLSVTTSPVYVNRVSNIIGLDAGTEARYSGVAEPQKTYTVNKDDSRTVSKIYVSVGDQVSPGDVLFRYDTEEMDLSISQAELDLDGIKNQISTLKSQLSTLESEKKKAGEDDQYSYTVQIQSVELQIRSAENNLAHKEAELEKLRQTRENADVVSEYEGTVKEINENPQYDMYGNAAGFISILSSGDVRIKGTISELNLYTIYEGMEVSVISRIDPSVTWQGTIDAIDLEPTSNQNNNYYYYGADMGESSSKYNFYVTLTGSEGLILGQHVYIEPTGYTARRTGIWLPGIYVVNDNALYYVWAAGDNGKLEKRRVTVGEYDANEDLYQITAGLSRMDSIAYPNDDLKAGSPTTDDASLASQNGPEGMMGGSDSFMDAPGYSVDTGDIMEDYAGDYDADYDADYGVIGGADGPEAVFGGAMV